MTVTLTLTPGAGTSRFLIDPATCLGPSRATTVRAVSSHQKRHVA
jgi:hypothetical protein